MKFEFIQIIGIVTCLLIVGEALALLTGLLIFKKPSLNWANGVNITLVLTDLLLGGYLGKHYLSFITINNTTEMLLVIMVLIATHSFRASQTLRMAKNPYCFNRSLGIINWIKLAGLLILFFFYARM